MAHKDVLLGSKAFELLFWEDEPSSILGNFSDLQARRSPNVCSCIKIF